MARSRLWAATRRGPRCCSGSTTSSPTSTATDTDTLVYMANNVRNVPTTFASLKASDLDVTPQFKTFLDVFANPNSHDKPPTPIGSADQDVVSSFAEKWEVGT